MSSPESSSVTFTAAPRELLAATAGFRLADVDPNSTPGIVGNKKDGAKLLAESAAQLSDLQELLFANSLNGDTRSVLLVLQAMDTAGKGGIVHHVMGSVNPQGISTAAFKKPTPEELEHDFLWRIKKRVPAAGMIGVFDRSHYEDVLVARVRSLATPETIEERYGMINEFEQQLAEQGVTLVKVMLHISSEEQKQRLQDRLDDPNKHWKYNPGDVDERLVWTDYQEAYQLAIERTSTAGAPWFVVPANSKWYARIAVQRLLIDALTGLGQSWPAADFDVETEKARLTAS